MGALSATIPGEGVQDHYWEWVPLTRIAQARSDLSPQGTRRGEVTLAASPCESINLIVKCCSADLRPRRGYSAVPSLRLIEGSRVGAESVA